MIASGGVASVTRIDTARYNIEWTTAFDSDDYIITAIGRYDTYSNVDARRIAIDRYSGYGQRDTDVDINVSFDDSSDGFSIVAAWAV